MNATASGFIAKVLTASSTFTTVEKDDNNKGQDQYTRVPLGPSAKTALHEPASNSAVFILIVGPLSEGRELAHPITVKIEEEDREEGEDREFIVSEPKYHIHGAEATVSDALAAFRRAFSEYLDILSEEEGNLSHMRGQLEYLRSAIRIL